MMNKPKVFISNKKAKPDKHGKCNRACWEGCDRFDRMAAAENKTQGRLMIHYVEKKKVHPPSTYEPSYLLLENPHPPPSADVIRT